VRRERGCGLALAITNQLDKAPIYTETSTSATCSITRLQQLDAPPLPFLHATIDYSILSTLSVVVVDIATSCTCSRRYRDVISAFGLCPCCAARCRCQASARLSGQHNRRYLVVSTRPNLFHNVTGGFGVLRVGLFNGALK